MLAFVTQCTSALYVHAAIVIRMPAQLVIVCVCACPQTVREVPWFTERIIADVTLGSLIIIVLYRMAQYNLTSLQVGALTHFVKCPCSFRGVRC